MATVYWQHLTGAGDANGVMAYRVSSGGNGDVLAVGGYAAAVSAPASEVDGASAQGLMPIVVTIPVRNSEESDWDMMIGFAVPTSLPARAHIWVMTA